MTDEELTVLAIRGAISELQIADRVKCLNLAAQFRKLVESELCGVLAFALVGAEMAEREARGGI